MCVNNGCVGCTGTWARGVSARVLRHWQTKKLCCHWANLSIIIIIIINVCEECVGGRARQGEARRELTGAIRNRRSTTKQNRRGIQSTRGGGGGGIESGARSEFGDFQLPNVCVCVCCTLRTCSNSRRALALLCFGYCFSIAIRPFFFFFFFLHRVALAPVNLDKDGDHRPVPLPF